MSRFVGNLELDYMRDADGRFLCNPDGRWLYDTKRLFGFQSDLLKCTIMVKIGFITDLASIPRMPLIYLLLNGFADPAGVIHDYAYSTGCISRKDADAMLHEACLVLGMSHWKAWLIWAGVRVGGANHYSADYRV